MSKKDWKILLTGILIGIILALGFLKAADVLFLPSVEMEEDLMLDDFSYEMNDQSEVLPESSDSAVEAEDLENP
jgi:hypothetical protein